MRANQNEGKMSGILADFVNLSLSSTIRDRLGYRLVINGPKSRYPTVVGLGKSLSTNGFLDSVIGPPFGL